MGWKKVEVHGKIRGLGHIDGVRESKRESEWEREYVCVCMTLLQQCCEHLLTLQKLNFQMCPLRRWVVACEDRWGQWWKEADTVAELMLEHSEIESETLLWNICKS